MKIKDESKAIGGVARAAALPADERAAIAQKAAKARWSIPQAQYSGELKIGDMAFPCSVLSDGSRVLTQSDFMSGMGMYYSGWVSNNQAKSEKSISADVPHFLAFKSLEPFINKHLGNLQSISLKYRTGRGNAALGIRAEIIPKICDVWLDADENGKLGIRQKKIAKSAKLIMRSLAHVGIIALVDEATGFQRDRASDALAKILEQFIAKELQPWIHTFKDDYYENLFRLRGLSYPMDTVKKPAYFGHLTNNIVYARLAPKVLEELKKDTPRAASGRHKHQLHRKLTSDVGHPKLKEHLASVVSLMKISKTYPQFETYLDVAHPKFNETIPLPLEDASDAEGI